jgi:hypothetical protein
MPKVVGLERRVCALFTTSEGNGRNLLRELLRIPQRVAGLSQSMARKVLQLPGEGEVPNMSNGG